MRLALRALFWLVLAAAVTIGWGVEHTRAVERLERMRGKGFGERLAFAPIDAPSGADQYHVAPWPEAETVPSGITAVPLLAILTVGGVVMLISLVRSQLRSSDSDKRPPAALFTCRDVLPFVIVVSLAAGWLADSCSLAKQLRAAQLDQDADWTMRLVE